MENTTNILLDEEPIIYCPSTNTNFGVHSKKIKSPKNFFMSFTPVSSNREISFTNTIMLPTITTEATTDTEKNASHFENEKSKRSIKKDSTRLKTESSKDEKNNLSYDKQITKILDESNEISKEEENENDTEIKLKESLDQKDSLEMNPFFLGSFNVEVNNNINMNDNSLIEEEKKVNKILNKGRNSLVNHHKNLFYKTSKNIKNNINNEIFKNKLIRRTKRMKTLVLDNSKNEDSSEKEQTKKITRKNIKGHTTIFMSENKLFKNYNYLNKVRNSEIALNPKNLFVKTRGKNRRKTVVGPSPIVKIKDNNIKIYRANLFNLNSSKKIKTKMKTHILREVKENIDEKEEEDEKSQKNKAKKFKYIGMSENSLNTKIFIDTPKNKKSEEKFEANKRMSKLGDDLKLKRKESHEYTFNIKARKRSQTINQFKRLKTFNKGCDSSDKKKIQTINKRKFSESRKNIDFESALKNKNNLANTQFNLFSPDKFTNTQFCGSDYCEYTLDCMDLILNKNKSQRQQKSKVNFNFPKPAKNKPQKKIALFDLDETLVHCTGDININKESYQHSIDIVLPGNKEVTVGINIRPFWKKTLNLIKKHYHIVVFTASHQAYADAVLDFMDPSKKYFKYRLYRNNCSLVDVEGAKFYVKDLDIFDESYDLKDIVIVDNSVLSFIYHLENGIPIVPYYNEDKDGSLYVVGLYLMHIYKEDDLREANKKYINLDSFLKEAKERRDMNSTINEESISVENNNFNTNEINTNSNGNINNNPPLMLDLNKVNNINQSEKEIIACPTIRTNRRNSICNSLQNEKEHQNKLISQSKLINMYYSINDKCVSKFETKNKNNITSDDEKDINDNESDKDNSSLFLKQRYLTNQIEPKRTKIKFKNSNKTCRDYLDLKLVCSNFNNNFFPEKVI